MNSAYEESQHVTYKICKQMANVILLLTEQICIENLVRSWGYNISTTEVTPTLTEFKVRKGIKKKNQTISVQLHLRRAKVHRPDVV